MKHLSPTEALHRNLRTAARADVAPDSTGLTLHDYLPTHIMPTPEMLEAVYAITGTSEEHRRLRSHHSFKMSAETEAAFCRAALKRWAVLNPEHEEPEPAPEPEPEPVKQAVALHFTMDAGTNPEDVKDQLESALQRIAGLNDMDIVWLDRDRYAGELAAAVKARDVDASNDGEMEALWDLAGTACLAFNVYDDDEDDALTDLAQGSLTDLAHAELELSK